MGVISSRWAKKGESQQVLLELVLDAKGRTGSGGSREREGVSDSTDRGWDGEGHAGVCGLQASGGGGSSGRQAVGVCHFSSAPRHLPAHLLPRNCCDARLLAHSTWEAVGTHLDLSPCILAHKSA